MDNEFKAVYDNGQAIEYRGKIIGEVYRTTKSGEWGWLCYASDNGEEGSRTAHGARQECVEEFKEWFTNIQRKYKKIYEELQKWDVGE